ncbi:MAG: LuxR family transcriptional regulator [Alphaproteobacteria bacterium]|nr:MAG: LuxR family transcriptional regulator [Alphaproteobacteria bacterium]
MERKRNIDELLEELGAQAPEGYYISLHLRFASPLMTYQTYNQAWIDHYTRHSYLLRDPLVAWGVSRTGTTRWSELDLPDPFGIFAEAAEYGLRYGMSVACGPTTSRTIASLARADREFSDEEIETVRAIVEALHAATEPPAALTPAEAEALRIVASGERYAAGAARLGISESAFKARLKSARTKLFARTSAEAIQRAKEYRLI